VLTGERADGQAPAKLTRSRPEPCFWGGQGLHRKWNNAADNAMYLGSIGASVGGTSLGNALFAAGAITPLAVVAFVGGVALVVVGRANAKRHYTWRFGNERNFVEVDEERASRIFQANTSKVRPPSLTPVARVAPSLAPLVGRDRCVSPQLTAEFFEDGKSVLQVKGGKHDSRPRAAADLRARVAEGLRLPVEAVHVEWLGTDKLEYYSFMLRPWVMNDRAEYASRLAAVLIPLQRFLLAARTDPDCPASHWFANFTKVGRRPLHHKC
jgi:hypothetical protein